MKPKCIHVYVKTGGIFMISEMSVGSHYISLNLQDKRLLSKCNWLVSQFFVSSVVILVLLILPSLRSSFLNSSSANV